MNIEIVEFEDHHHTRFKSLNVAWLDQYNLMESHDLEILDNPQKYILGTGGVIYLAVDGNEVVGSAALMKDHEGVYELVKMAVVPTHQGKGISRLLLDTCLQKARALKATKIILFSNHQLKAALGLYEKFGFQHVPVIDSPFVTADVRMELVL